MVLDLQPLGDIRQRYDSIERALESLMRAREEAALLPPGTCQIDPLDAEIERLYAQVAGIRKAAVQAGFILQPFFEVNAHGNHENDDTRHF